MTTQHTAPFEPSFASLSQFQCPDWFRDAKVGIWSHWGAQSVPRQGDWYARNMYMPGTAAYSHHWRNYGHPSQSGYKDIVALWKAERFDAEALVDLYARAGARYIVTQAVHHDHFLNYASRLHRWNSVDMGPHKDIVGMWRDAARARGLRFGMTEHLGATFSWFAVNKGADDTGPYAGVPYDGNDEAFEDLYLPNRENYDAAHKMGAPVPWYTTNKWWHQRWLALVTEMIDMYQPDLLYSDGELPFGEHQYDAGLRAVAHLYNASAARNSGINEAVYNHKGRAENQRALGVLDVERSQEPDIMPFVWQTDTCVGEWFYNDRARYKTPAHVIELLIDIVSKNGNLLLNIPQLPDGSIDEECTYLLQQLAQWIAVCGEGIYNTRPLRVCGEGPSTVTIDGYREDRVTWTSRDYRFTRRDETIYAFQMRWPEDHQAIINSMPTDKHVTAVRLLGGDQLPYEQHEKTLHITLPEKPAAPYTNCLAIDVS